MTNLPQDRYVLQRRLGSGGMGEVWLADDTLLNRRVAIKYLKATQEPRRKELFLAEARTLASLNHPNITLIYDAVFDERQNGFYLVMEYVEGQPLSRLVENWSGPLPLEITLEVTTGVLQALQYAHAKGIVHLDIKPANVMMQQDGVKLTDFGVAGLISLLAQGNEYIVGTPAYIAPEQIDGLGLDGRADLYSLGVMLFELVSGGQLPFEEYTDTKEIFQAHLEETPPPLCDVAPHLHPALEHLITRLLAKDPAERYPSAGAVLEVVKSIQARQKYSQAHLKWLELEAQPLVDRTSELEQLQAVWGETRKIGKPQLVVVKGRMGIGKSRLIVEFLGREVVDQEFVVIAGKCAETDVPYSPYTEILATALSKGLAKPASPEQLNLLLEHIPGLARLLNIPYKGAAKEAPTGSMQRPTSSGLWSTLSTKVPESEMAIPVQPPWQLFATILTLLSELGPTVLFLEDATMLDEWSLALTRFLIRQGQLPLLLVAACRETNQSLAWLDSLAADETVTISVPPLPKPSIQEFITHRLGGSVSEPVVNLVAERSQGNPLRLEGLIPQLIQAQEIYQEVGEWRYQPKKLEAPADAFLPKAVFDAFTRQLESLSEAYREALSLAALCETSSEFDFELWLALLGGEVQRTLAEEVLVEAGKRRLIRQVNDRRYAFRSTDMHKALASALPQTRRRELHGQLAEILRQQQSRPDLIGYHYEQAGLTAEAAHYLELAGASAALARTTDAAIDYYRRAVTLRESTPAYQALGRLYRQAGQRGEAAQALQHALALAEQAGEMAEQARTLNELSKTLWWYDHYKEAYQHAMAVFKLRPVPEAEWATAQAHLTMILWLVGRLSEAESWGQKAVQTSLSSGDEVVVAGANYRLGLVYLSQGKLTEATRLFQQALELRQKLADVGGQGKCLKVLGQVALEQGDFEQALTRLNSARQLCEQAHHQDGLVAVYTQQGRVSLYQNQPNDTLTLLNSTLRLAVELGQRSVHLLSDVYLLIAQASLAVGKVSRAKVAADSGLKLVEAVGNRVHVAENRATLAQIYAVQGDMATAETFYQKALTLFEQTGARSGLLRTQFAYAHFLRQQGQISNAAALEQAAQTEAANLGLYLLAP